MMPNSMYATYSLTDSIAVGGMMYTRSSIERSIQAIMLANLVAGVSSYIFPDWQTRVHVLVAYYCARLKVAISGKSCERDMNEGN